MAGLTRYVGDEDDEEKEEVYLKSNSNSSGWSWDAVSGDSPICGGGKSSTDVSWCSSDTKNFITNSKKMLDASSSRSSSVRLLATLNPPTNSSVVETKLNSQSVHIGKIEKRRFSGGGEDDSLDVDNFSSGSNNGCSSPCSWSSLSTIPLRLPSWGQGKTPIAIRSDSPLKDSLSYKIMDKVEEEEGEVEKKKAVIRFVNNSANSRQKAHSKFVTLRHSSSTSSSLAPQFSSPYHPKLSLWKKNRRKKRTSVESTTTTTSLDSTSSLFKINPLKVPTFTILESPNSCRNNCSSDNQSSNNSTNNIKRSGITDFGNKGNPSASMMNTHDDSSSTHVKCTVDSSAETISLKSSSKVVEANLEATGISNNFVGGGQGKQDNSESPTARIDTGKHQEFLGKPNNTLKKSSFCVKIMYDPLDDENFDDEDDDDDDNDELPNCTKTNSSYSKCSEDQIISSIYRFNSQNLNKKEAYNHSESSTPDASFSPPDVNNSNNTSPSSHHHPPPLHFSSSSSAAGSVPFRSSPQPLSSSTKFLTSCASRLAHHQASPPTAIAAPRRCPPPPPLVSSRATTALVSPSGSPTWTTPSCTTPSASLDNPLSSSEISICKAKKIGVEEQGHVSLETEASGVSWAFSNSPLLSPSSSKTSNRDFSLKPTAPNRYRQQSFAVTSELSETTTQSDRSSKSSRRSRSCSSHDAKKTNTSLPSLTKFQSPPRPNYIRLSRKCSEGSLRIETTNCKTETASFKTAFHVAETCPLVATSFSSDGSTPAAAAANRPPLGNDDDTSSTPHVISSQSSLLQSSASFSVALSALSPSIPNYEPCIRDEATGNREQDIDKKVLWHSWGGGASSFSSSGVSIGDDQGTLPNTQSSFDLIQFLHSSGIAELCHSVDSGRDLEDDAIGDRKEGQGGSSLSTISPFLKQSDVTLKPMLLPFPLPRNSSIATAESVPQQWAAVTPHFGPRRCGFSITTNSDHCSIISEHEEKNHFHHPDISSSFSFPTGGSNTNEITLGKIHDPINHMEKSKTNWTLQSEGETIGSPMTSFIEQPLRPPTPASLTTTLPSSISTLSSLSAPTMSSSSSSTIPSDSFSSSCSMSSSSSVMSYSSASTSTLASSSNVSIPPFPSISLHTSQRRSVSEPRRRRQQFLLTPSVSTVSSSTFLPSFGKAENVSKSFADSVSFQSGQVSQQRQQDDVASISDLSYKNLSFPFNLSSEQLTTRDSQECLVMQSAEDFSSPVARGFSPNASHLRSASLPPPFSFQVATRENMDSSSSSSRGRVCGGTCNPRQIDTKLTTIDYSSRSSSSGTTVESIYTTDTSGANRNNGHQVFKGIHDYSFSSSTTSSTLSPSSELNSAVRNLYSSTSTDTHITGTSSSALLSSSFSIPPLLSSSTFSGDNNSTPSSSSSSPYSSVELLDTRHLPPKIVQTKWGPVQVTANGELKITFRARSELAMFYGEEELFKQKQDNLNTAEQKAEKKKVINSGNAEYMMMSGENDDKIRSSVTIEDKEKQHMKKDKRKEVSKEDKTKKKRRPHYKVMDMVFVVEGGGLFVRIEEPQTGRVLKRFHVRELPPRQMLRYDYARNVVDAFRRHTAKITLRKKGIGTFRLMSNIPQPYFLASLGEVFLFIKQIEIQKEVVNFRTRMGDKLSISVEDLTLLTTTNPISSNESDFSSDPNKVVVDNENAHIIMKRFLQASQRAQISLEGIFQSWHITLQAYKDCLELENKNQRLYSQTVTQEILAHLEKADEQWLLHEDKNVCMLGLDNASCMNVEDIKRKVFNRYFPVVVDD